MEINPYAPPSAILTRAPEAAAVESIPLFFPVSKTKLLLMYLATFGLYQLHWFYENWKLIRAREDADIMPLARTIFGIFFCHSLFQRMSASAEENEVAFTPGPGFLAIVWILLSLTYKLPDPLWAVTFLSVFPLLRVQGVVNELNRRAAPDHDPNARFSAMNIIGLVIGSVFLLLVVIGLAMPAGG